MSKNIWAIFYSNLRYKMGLETSWTDRTYWKSGPGLEIFNDNTLFCNKTGSFYKARFCTVNILYFMSQKPCLFLYSVSNMKIGQDFWTFSTLEFVHMLKTVLCTWRVYVLRTISQSIWKKKTCKKCTESNVIVLLNITG